MGTQQITFQILPYGTASLALPEFLTPDTFASLDNAIHQVLGAGQEPPRNGATSDPASAEYDSWLAQLR